MSHVTLTVRNGDTLELSMPLRAEEYLKRPAPYFLAYGTAEVSFDTPDESLNQALSDNMPEKAGIKELSLLAYILGKKDDNWLAQLQEKLPEKSGSIAELLENASSAHDWNNLMERYTRKLNQDVETQRMTGGQLFDAVMARARENGDLVRFDAINEYVLAEDCEKGKLCSYGFDLLPAVDFGGSEGIYIDCSLQGKFDESGRKSLHIGTIKTLDTGLDACKAMGELCGALLYYESRFVNENLYLFDSAESIERMLTKPLTLEQAQTEAQTMTCQQM